MKSLTSPTQYFIIPTDSDRDTPNKLFLGGISIHATEKALVGFFSQFGKVKDVRIVTDRITAEGKGYGFVTFDENENVDLLLEKKVVRMNGKKIRIRRAIRRHGSQFDEVNAFSPARSRSTSLDLPLVQTPCTQRRRRSYSLNSALTHTSPHQYNTSQPRNLMKHFSDMVPPMHNPFCPLSTSPSPEHDMNLLMNTQLNPMTQMELSSQPISPQLKIPSSEIYMPSFYYQYNQAPVQCTLFPATQSLVYIPSECPQPYTSYPMHLTSSYQMSA